MPAAEVDVTPELARRLLEDQHPDLAELPLAPLSRGWDNTMYRLGDELSVRLPHRRVAADLLLAEQRWLPLLGPDLPLPSPVPVRAGTATEYYPWAWSVVPWFDGSPVGPEPALGPDATDDLGRFLAALHRPAADDAPVNTGRGVPLAHRHDITMRHIDAVAGHLSGDALRKRWDRYLQVPTWDGAPMWLHGDLHPMNLLQREGRLAAVIDFGDITSGDPATDLAIGFSLFNPEERDRFRRAAESPDRPIDDHMWHRAEGWAMSVGLAVVNNSADSPAMLQVGLAMIGD